MDDCPFCGIVLVAMIGVILWAIAITVVVLLT